MNMKKRLLSLILAFAFVLPLLNFGFVSAEELVIFSDDFESGLAKWSRSTPSCFTVGNFDSKQLLFMSNADMSEDSIIASGNFSGTYTVEFDLISPDGYYAGVYVNYQDSNNYYLVKINLKAGELQLYKRVSGGEEELITSGGFPMGDSAHFLVTADGKTISVAVDGKDYLIAEDTKFISGKTGFWGSNSAYRADNVSVVRGEQGFSDSDYVVAGKINLPSSINGKVDGTTTKSQYLDRRAQLPEEIDLVEPYEVKGEKEIFIAPDGSDDNAGTIDAPFATLQRAVKEVEYCNSFTPRPKGIVIYLREGQYSINETIDVGAGFSGTEDAPVFISAYNNEKVSFVSGLFVNGSEFTPVTDANALKKLDPAVHDKVLVANLSQYGLSGFGDMRYNMLYADGNEMTLARYPDFNDITMGKVIRGGNSIQGGAIILDIPRGVEYVPSDMRVFDWEDTGKIIFSGAFCAQWDHYEAWLDFDEVNRTVSTTTQSYYAQAKSHPSVLHCYRNVFEEITVPGEWYIDEQAKKLYVYPFSDDKTYDYYLSCTANDIITFNDVSNVVINEISLEGSGSRGYSFYNCENCIIQDSEIKNTKNEGALFRRCTGCGVLDSYIYNVGFADKYGIYFNSFDYDDESNFSSINWSNTMRYSIGPEVKPRHNFVQNCFASCPNGTHVAIGGALDTQCVFSHNVVTNTYRYAFYQQNCPEGIIEQNETCVVPKNMWDAGSIYIVGKILPTAMHIRNNFVHDAADGATGIYLDCISSDSQVYDNVLYNINECGISLHGGRDVAAVNNIVISTNDEGWHFSGIETSDDYFYGSSPEDYHFAEYIIGKGNIGESVHLDGTVYNQIFYDRYPRYMTRLAQAMSVMDEKEKMGSNYVRGEKEDIARMPSWNYFENNIFIGKKNNIKISDSVKNKTELYANYEGDSRYNVGFANLDEYDFTLPADAPARDIIPGFENINLDNIGLVRKDGRWDDDKLPKLEKTVAYLPANGSTGTENHEKVMFKWLPQAMAHEYTLTVALDPEFKNIVHTGVTKHPQAEVVFDEPGHTYYWKIDSKSLLKSIKAEPTVSDVYTFTTMTEAERLVKLKPDTTYFETCVRDAELFMDSIVEDGENATFKPGSKDYLKKIIASAEKEMAKALIQSEADEICSRFEKEWVTVKKFSVPRYVYINPMQDMTADKINTGNPGAVKYTNDEVYFDKSVGSFLYREEKTNPGDILCFQMKLDDFTQWFGVTPAYDAEVTPRYWIIWKPDQVELQVNDPRLASQTFLKTVKLEGIDWNDWVDVQLGTVMTEQGVWITVKLNGKTVIDFLDTEEPIYTGGNFRFDINSANGGIHIKATDTVYEEDIVPSVTSGDYDMHRVYKEE